MATPDHRAQIAYRDTEVQLGGTGPSTVVSGQGGIRYSGTAFQLLDAAGQYDPRTASILAHASVYDMPHVLAGAGPALNSAYKTQTFYNGVFLNTETWWLNSAQLIKLSTHQFVYGGSSYVNPTREIWTLFDGSAQNNVIKTVSDQIFYSGVVEVGRQRTCV